MFQILFLIFLQSPDGSILESSELINGFFQVALPTNYSDGLYTCSLDYQWTLEAPIESFPCMVENQVDGNHNISAFSAALTVESIESQLEKQEISITKLKGRLDSIDFDKVRKRNLFEVAFTIMSFSIHFPIE